MLLTDEQMQRELGYCRAVSAFESLMKAGVLSAEEFSAAKALMERKYSPIIRIIS